MKVACGQGSVGCCLGCWKGLAEEVCCLLLGRSQFFPWISTLIVLCVFPCLWATDWYRGFYNQYLCVSSRRCRRFCSCFWDVGYLIANLIDTRLFGIGFGLLQRLIGRRYLTTHHFFYHVIRR